MVLICIIVTTPRIPFLLIVGNCPKYITIREMDSSEPQDTLELEAGASTSQTLDENSRRPLFKGLTLEQTAIVDQADCLFIASRFIDESIADQTSGMDCNHRGGNPGFARVNGNQIAFPDYSGNRVSKRALLAFLSCNCANVAVN